MSRRPPYSTFRANDRVPQSEMFPTATSGGNVLSFTPPGFKQCLNVKFPDTRLAVCEACKKNFKTRDMCRVRNQHTAPPWTMAYICMTLDESCLDEYGRYVDKPMVCRMVEWQSYRVVRDFDKKTPVCATCKKTNRTKQFCREKHKHRQLPWCTVYVMLSTLDSADPSTVVAAPSKPIGACISSDTEDSKVPATEANSPPSAVREGITRGPGNTGKDRPLSESPQFNFKDETSVAESKGSDLSEHASPADYATRLAELGEGDDINRISETRTMLVKVSTVGSVITWLEHGEDVQSSRRNLTKPLGEYRPTVVPHPGMPQVGQVAGREQRQQLQTQVQTQNAYLWPIAYGLPHPNASTKTPLMYHQQMQPGMSYAPPGWQYGSSHPQQPIEYRPHQQQVPVHYVPIVQQSPIPSGTPVIGLDTPADSSPHSNAPLGASPQDTTRPPVPVTAGEAAAAERLKRSVGESECQERRVSQSPVQPSVQQPPQIPRLLHPRSLPQAAGGPILPGPISVHSPPHSVMQVPSQLKSTHPPTHGQPPHYQAHQQVQAQYQQQWQWVASQNQMFHQQQFPQPYPGIPPAYPGAPSLPSEASFTTEDTRRSDGEGPLPVTYHSPSASPGKRLSHSMQEEMEYPVDVEEDVLNNIKRPRLL